MSIRTNFIKLILLLCAFCISAQKATAQNDTAVSSKGIQVSLLTCGAGSEIYSVFGHSAVRIVDSLAMTDIVYNYGTFEYDEDFEIKFMRGKLLYQLSEDNYIDFINAYQEEGRWVEEQIINLSAKEKKQIQDYLLTNMEPDNRSYKYDFFFDNCATRIRDIFTQTNNKQLILPMVLPAQNSLSFRDIINRYLVNNKWERLGINILLGSKIDQKMTNEQIMFLPDYLEDAIEGATLKGDKFASPKNRIVAEKNSSAQNDGLFWLILCSILAATLLGLFIPKLSILGAVMTNLLLILTGFLGILMLIMWFATDHQTCAQNFNLLWALPTNVFFIFRKKQYKYALVAIILIIVSFIIHISGIQKLLLPEMLPILLSLLVVYANIYKNKKNLAKY